MVIQSRVAKAKPQIIPTNAGGRTFAVPPKALQNNIVPNDLFYIRNHWKEVPDIDVASYRLAVDGEVERPISLTFDEIKQLPQKRFQVTFECCGNSPVPEYWAKSTRTSSVMEQIKGHGIMGNAEWAGASLADVLELAGVKSSAVEVMFEGADHGPDEIVGDPAEVTYERAIPIAKATHADTLLAYEMNGDPLPPPHGFPLRLLVPGWYGMTSIKWLMGIHVLDHEFQGFYQKERYMTMNEPGSEIAYTAYTTMKIKSIITNPVPGEIVPTGDYVVAGKAWSGEDDVVKVEISSDGGDTWDDAQITVKKSGYSWYRWEYNWTAPGPGSYILKSRATNDKGETQPMEFPNKWDGRGYGNNMVFPHPVEVKDR